MQGMLARLQKVSQEREAVAGSEWRSIEENPVNIMENGSKMVENG